MDRLCRPLNERADQREQVVSGLAKPARPCARSVRWPQEVVLASGRSVRQNRFMLRLELYPFKFRDPLTGKWIRARHKLQVPALQRRYAEWEIIGPAKIRHVLTEDPVAFDPFRPLNEPPMPPQAVIAPMPLWTT
jgi:hypothetical protein